MAIKVTSDFDFGRLAEMIRREMDFALRRSADILRARIVSVITRKKLINEGTLRNSIKVQHRLTQPKKLSIVGTNVIHAVPLELGIKKRFFPNVQMVEALESWSRKKNVGPFEATKSSAIVLSALNFSKEEIKESPSHLHAAAAIARKIGRKGLDKRRFPARFVEKGTVESAPQILATMRRHMTRAIQLSRTLPK